MPREVLSTPQADAWSKENVNSFEHGLKGLSRNLLGMINSEHFPDWAREAISARLD